MAKRTAWHGHDLAMHDASVVLCHAGPWAGKVAQAQHAYSLAVLCLPMDVTTGPGCAQPRTTYLSLASPATRHHFYQCATTVLPAASMWGERAVLP